MKKSTSKGDKKKKKELTEEIAKMEQALEEKHKKEKKDLQEGQGDTETGQSVEKVRDLSHNMRYELNLWAARGAVCVNLTSDPLKSIAQTLPLNSNSSQTTEAVNSLNLSSGPMSSAAAKDGLDDEEVGDRVSKAQKRREKKAAKEKQRREEIEAQDELNLTGSRQMEIDAIKALLTKRNLAVHTVRRNGL